MTYLVKKHIGILILLFVSILFTLYKTPHLYLPLFWDEIGVYGKSVFYLLDNEIGILPSYLEPELSRGHPMVYVYFTALFCKVFGENVFTMHLFNLIISIFLLFSVYYTSSKLFSKKVAFIAFIVLVVQPLFIAQSILVLPEVMLALFALWSIYFFITEKWICYFIFASLAMLTKETAVFIPPVLFFVWFIFNYQKEKKLLKLFYVFLPFISFFIFLLIQKMQNGWYFFPYHNPLEEGFFHLKTVLKKFIKFTYVLFAEQGRFVSSFFALVGIIPLFIISNKSNKFKIFTLVSIIIGLILFSSTNHFMKRYLMLAIIPYSIIVAFVISKISNKWLFSIVLVIIIISSLYHTKSKYFDYDNNMSYIEVIEYHKKILTFLKSQEDWNSNIAVTSNFPLNLFFEDIRFGYEQYKHKVVYYNVEEDSKYIIETNPGSYTKYKIPTNYIKIPFEKEGFNSVSIYKKKSE